MSSNNYIVIVVDYNNESYNYFYDTLFEAKSEYIKLCTGDFFGKIKSIDLYSCKNLNANLEVEVSE